MSALTPLPSFWDANAPPSLGECRGLPSSRTPSSSHSASNHRTTPGHRFSFRLTGTCLDRSSGTGQSRQSYVSAISVTGYSRLRPSLAGSPGCRAESSSSTCGLAVRLPLLSTPPRGDAVTVGFQCKTPFRSGLTPLWRGTLEGVRAASTWRARPSGGSVVASTISVHREAQVTVEAVPTPRPFTHTNRQDRIAWHERHAAPACWIGVVKSGRMILLLERIPCGEFE